MKGYSNPRPLTSQHMTELEKPGVPHYMRSMAEKGTIQVRDCHLMYGPKTFELVARYPDVAHLIKRSSGAWYKGVMPWSMAIRIGLRSIPSHGGILGNEDHHIQLIDTCEGIGCRKRLFKDVVHAEHSQSRWKGQWYWAPVSLEYETGFNREAAWTKANSMVGAKYGHLAILAMAMGQMPILREVAFMRWGSNIEKDWSEITPYCSMLQSIVASAGGTDPCPGRALQWTSPQDTWQSLFWSSKVALIP